jgi:hypothetical protein
MKTNFNANITSKHFFLKKKKITKQINKHTQALK